MYYNICTGISTLESDLQRFDVTRLVGGVPDLSCRHSVYIICTVRAGVYEYGLGLVFRAIEKNVAKISISEGQEHRLADLGDANFSDIFNFPPLIKPTTYS